MRIRKSGGCLHCLLWAGLSCSGLAWGQPGGDPAPDPPPADTDTASGVTDDQAVAPEGGGLPPAGPETSPLVDRVELAVQHAAAIELEEELSTLVGSDGLPIELGNADVRDALRDVATRCDLLSHGAGESPALRVLAETQARAHNALVQDAAAHGHAAEVARGLTQLRHAANRLAGLDVPGAEAAGAYWRMLADLIDVNRTVAEPHSRRLIARELFAHYVANYAEDAAEDPAARAYLADVRVALARMLDEAGRQQDAVDALGDLASAEPGDERYEQVRGVLARHGRLGEPVSFELAGPTGQPWRVADQAGRPLLIHLYQHGVEPTAGSVVALRRAIAQARHGGFAVVSIHVGAVEPGQNLPPWPTLVLEPGSRGVLEALGVDAVPAYVWLDAEGRLASIGRTPEVVSRVPGAELPPAEEPDEDNLPAEDAADAPAADTPASD